LGPGRSQNYRHCEDEGKITMKHFSMNQVIVVLFLCVGCIAFCGPRQSRAFTVSGATFNNLNLSSGPSGGGNSGGGGDSGGGQTYDPVAAQHDEAASLNQQGIEYYKNKNWAMAAQCFRAALKKWPEHETIGRNLKRAEDTLAEEEAEKASLRQMRKMLDQSAGQIWQTPAPTTSGLDFAGRNGAPEDHSAQVASSGGLNFMGSGETSGVKPLEEASANLGTTRKGLASPDTDTSRRPKGTKFFGTGGGGSGGSAGGAGEPAKDGAKGVFDDKAPRTPSGIKANLSGVGKAPLYPADMGNPRMVKAQQELTTLEKHGDELRAKLDKLTAKRNQAKDRAKMRELTAQVDNAQKEFGINQFNLYKKREEMDKLHRSIESDREQAAPPSGQVINVTKQGQ